MSKMRSPHWWEGRFRCTAVVVVGLLFAAASAAGCGSSPEKAAMDTSAEAQGLKNLGKMYGIVSRSLKRAPRTIDELRKAESEVPGGFNSIGETNVAIFLGAELTEPPGKPGDDASETVLAYDRMVPLQGGYVLMRDGSVHRMSAEEFKTAKKAGKKPWVAPAGS
jgi:hypothetical protein